MEETINNKNFINPIYIVMFIGFSNVLFRILEEEGIISITIALIFSLFLASGYNIIRFLYILGALIGGIVVFIFNFFGASFGYQPLYDSFIMFLIYEVWAIFTLYMLLFNKNIKMYFKNQTQIRKTKKQ